jgi:hypothetical protein
MPSRSVDLALIARSLPQQSASALADQYNIKILPLPFVGLLLSPLLHPVLSSCHSVFLGMSHLNTAIFHILLALVPQSTTPLWHVRNAVTSRRGALRVQCNSSCSQSDTMLGKWRSGEQRVTQTGHDGGAIVQSPSRLLRESIALSLHHTFAAPIQSLHA